MQPYSIEAVSPAPSNAVRSHEHPMLESGNLSFPSGSYILDFQPGKDRSSYTITHRIQGAALLSRVLDAGNARFVCIVSSPISSYRRTHVSETPQHLVRWNAHELGEPPMFTPMVVCSEAQEIILSSNRDERARHLGQPTGDACQRVSTSARQRHPSRILDSAPPFAARGPTAQRTDSSQLRSKLNPSGSGST